MRCDKTFRFHDAMILIATPDADGGETRKQPGGSKPDFKLFAALQRFLAKEGFKITADPMILARYRCLSPRHRIGQIHIGAAVLEAHLEANPIGPDIDFYELGTGDNPHGARYSFNKRANMSYHVGLKFDAIRARLAAYLEKSGYSFSGKAETPVAPTTIGQRLSALESGATLRDEHAMNAAALAYFNDSWDSEYERRRGVHRFRRDETGWVDASELASWDRRDGSGKILNAGDIRNFRSNHGHLCRGRVYGGINGRWLVVYGPGARDFTHRSAHELFSGSPGNGARRVHPRPTPLERLLAAAVSANEFDRAKVLHDLIQAKAAKVGGHYYVLSLKHDRDGTLTWWGSQNTGYTGRLRHAGLYGANKIAANLDYYNNGRTTLAIPVEAAEQILGSDCHDRSIAKTSAVLQQLRSAAPEIASKHAA